MKFNRIHKSIMFGAVILAATVAIAFAHGGSYGYDGQMMGPGMMGYGGYGGQMMGPGMMGYGGYGGHMMGYGHWTERGGNANLSEEQIAKFDAAREAFFKDTHELRDQIQDKRYSLNKELNKENPDTAAAVQLQKELSKLDSEFDQKRIEFQLAVRKILPEQEFNRGYGPGFNNGYCW